MIQEIEMAHVSTIDTDDLPPSYSRLYKTDMLYNTIAMDNTNKSLRHYDVMTTLGSLRDNKINVNRLGIDPLEELEPIETKEHNSIRLWQRIINTSFHRIFMIILSVLMFVIFNNIVYTGIIDNELLLIQNSKEQLITYTTPKNSISSNYNINDIQYKGLLGSLNYQSIKYINSSDLIVNTFNTSIYKTISHTTNQFQNSLIQLTNISINISNQTISTYSNVLNSTITNISNNWRNTSSSLLNLKNELQQEALFVGVEGSKRVSFDEMILNSSWIDNLIQNNNISLSNLVIYNDLISSKQNFINQLSFKNETEIIIFKLQNILNEFSNNYKSNVTNLILSFNTSMINKNYTKNYDYNEMKLQNQTKSTDKINIKYSTELEDLYYSNLIDAKTSINLFTKVFYITCIPIIVITILYIFYESLFHNSCLNLNLDTDIHLDQKFSNDHSNVYMINSIPNIIVNKMNKIIAYDDNSSTYNYIYWFSTFVFSRYMQLLFQMTIFSFCFYLIQIPFLTALEECKQKNGLIDYNKQLQNKRELIDDKVTATQCIWYSQVLQDVQSQQQKFNYQLGQLAKIAMDNSSNETDHFIESITNKVDEMFTNTPNLLQKVRRFTIN